MLARVPEVLVDTFNRMTAPDGVAMSVATCRTWGPLADATAKLAPDVRLTEMPDYFAWMLDGSPTRRSLTAEQFQAAVETAGGRPVAMHHGEARAAAVGGPGYNL